MRVTINTDSYNWRRYGRPYIGIVDPETGRVVRWERWIGTHGEEGILEIDAEPGEIIIEGQKDYRGRNGTPNYAVLHENGDLEYMTKAQAVRLARKMRQERQASAE